MKSNKEIEVINNSTGGGNYGLRFDINLIHLLLHLSMLIKLNPIHIFARQKEEVQPRKLTRQQHITCDRIVIMVIFLTTIVAAVLLS
jgi:hypothetical protein